MAWNLAQHSVVGNALNENLSLMNLAKGLGFSIASLITGQDGLLQDYNKMNEYFDSKLSVDKRLANSTDAWKNIFGFAGTLADLAFLYNVSVFFFND